MKPPERYFTNLFVLTEGGYLLLEMDEVEWTEPAYNHQN